MLYVKIGFLAGIFIASPLILYQVWKFIAPGLYSHEKKFAIPFVLMSTIFFVARRALLALRRVPVDVEVLHQLQHRLHDLHAEDRRGVFDIYTKMLLGFGIMFEMPTLVLLPGADGRRDRPASCSRYFKYAILVISIVAAVVSPGTDAMSMIVFADPDARPLSHQHRDRLHLPEAQETRNRLKTRPYAFRLIHVKLIRMSYRSAFFAALLTASTVSAQTPAPKPPRPRHRRRRRCGPPRRRSWGTRGSGTCRRRKFSQPVSGRRADIA